MPYLGFTYKVPLIGGWNNNPNFDFVPTSDFVDITNINLHNGGIEPRGGCEKVIETPITDTPQVMGIYQFTKEDGNSFIMTATADGKIQKDYTTELITGLTNDVDVFFETFYDTLYITNGNDMPQEWDGVQAETRDVGTPIACSAAVAGDSKGYVYGGHASGGNLQDCDEYDPDVWTSKTDMPAPAREFSAASTLGDKGYVYGGKDDGYLQDCDEYASDSWTNKTDMPPPARATFAASTIVDKGYVYGGLDGSRLQDCDEYTSDVWTTKTDMPAPTRMLLAASTIDGKGYVYGGSDIGGGLQDCDEYAPDIWTSKFDMPAPARYGLAASTIDGKGYVYGGYSGGYLLDCDEYTPDSWTNKTDMPPPARDSLAASTIGDAGYLYGGTDSGGYLQDCDEYDPDIWTSKPSMPAPARDNLAASTLGKGAGNVDDGTHSYKITYVTESGESSGGVTSNIITIVDKAANGQIILTDVPLGPPSITSRKVYRTIAGDTGNYKLSGTIENNSATIYIDNIADDDLGTDVPSANLALLPSDWESEFPKYFIIHGRGSSQRLWAYGCAAYPNKVYASGSGEFDFSDASVTVIEVLTGHGDGIVGMVEFGERLFACSKKKTYIIEDTSLIITDWGYTAAQWEGGAASQKLIVKTATDIIFITEDLEIVSVKAAIQFGDYQAASISRPAFIHTWMADNVDSTDIDKFHAVYDPELRAIKIFVMHTIDKTQLDTVLVFYVDSGRWTKHLHLVGQSCSALVNVSTAIWKIYTGGYAGYVYSLESATLRDAGEIYESSFKTPPYALDNPRTHKKFDKIWLVLRPVAFETIKAIISVDGRNMSGGYFVVDENGYYLGDEYGNYIVSEPTTPWSITVDGAEDILKNYDYFLGSTGIRIQTLFYNEDGNKYFLSQILFDFNDLGANDGY